MIVSPFRFRVSDETAGITMPEIVFEDSRRKLLILGSSAYDPAFLELLDRTVWGSGGLQYAIQGMSGILNRLKEPHFLTLTEDHEPVGVLTLSKKITRLEEEEVPAFYSYGLAVAAHRQGKGYGTFLAEQALLYGLRNLGEKGIYYGYVETENIRSLKALRRAGRESLGQYHSLVISRLRPKYYSFGQLEQRNRDQLVKLLYRQYRNHSLVDFEYSVKAESYYIVKEGDEIIAGVQCERNHLTIKHLPGAGGLFILKVLPYIPILNKLLPDGNYHFLTFGNIYVKAGYEVQLFKLFESLLARHQLNFGMIYIDKRSLVYQKLESAGKFGVFNAMVDVPVQVMAFIKGLTGQQKAEILRKPLFISIMDPV